LKSTVNPLLTVLLAITLASSVAKAEKASLLPAFSSLSAIGEDWTPLTFPNIEAHTQYQLVSENGQQVVRAMADDSASGLIHRLTLTPGDSLTLRWRWKVSNVYEGGDARQKSGDDYPARIYVAFRFQPDQAGFFERAKRKAAELLFGAALPGNAINYIWANRVPVGETIANPYTEKTMMIAVNSGTSMVGQWVTVERDIVADYRQAFGESPPPVVGVAIMTDSDNTGEKATAWYGDLILQVKKTSVSRH
jgi:hypothetical protein